jgi:hypothetical protein
MVKRKVWTLLLSAVMLVTLLGGAASITAQGQAVLTLTALDVGVAETGVIEGRIECGIGGCGGFNITLSFDRSLVRIEEAAVGPYLGDQILLAENTVDNPAGQVRLVARRQRHRPRGG